MPTLTELIPRTEWVGALTAAERAEVDRQAEICLVPKGERVCHLGEPALHWIGVLDGLVKIATNSSEGKLAAFAGIPSGGWFGEGSLLKNEPRHYEVIALRDSQIAYVKKPVFQLLLAHNPRFVRFLMMQLNERLGLAMSVIEQQRLLGPDGRVAQCLANLWNPTLYPGLGATMRISQEEIGLLAGLSRQRVNVALKRLQQAGLLRTENLGLTVLDLPALRCFKG